MAKGKDSGSTVSTVSKSAESVGLSTGEDSGKDSKSVPVPEAGSVPAGNGNSAAVGSDGSATGTAGATEETEARRQTVYIRMEHRTPGTPEYDEALDLIARAMGGPFTLQSGLIQKYGLDLSRFTVGGIKKVAEALSSDNLTVLRMFNSSL